MSSIFTAPSCTSTDPVVSVFTIQMQRFQHHDATAQIMYLNAFAVQLKQEDAVAWQYFCTTSIVVEAPSLPRGLGLSPAPAPAQGSEGDLYQHRLPQLSSRMQALLIKAGSAWCGAPEGKCLLASSCMLGTFHTQQSAEWYASWTLPLTASMLLQCPMATVVP